MVRETSQKHSERAAQAGCENAAAKDLVRLNECNDFVFCNGFALQIRTPSRPFHYDEKSSKLKNAWLFILIENNGKNVQKIPGDSSPGQPSSRATKPAS